LVNDRGPLLGLLFYLYSAKIGVEKKCPNNHFRSDLAFDHNHFALYSGNTTSKDQMGQ